MKKTNKKVGQEVKIKKFISRKLPKTEMPYDLIFDGRTRTGSKIKSLSKVLNTLLTVLSAVAIAYLFINVFSVAW